MRWRSMVKQCWRALRSLRDRHGAWARGVALLPCFFCGVDSRGVVILFVSVIGLGVLGAFAFLLWSIARGDFRDIEQPKYEIFKAEERY